MKTLRRFNLKHHYYFITIVTFNRRNILLHDSELFKIAWKEQKLKAWVIMPNHTHFIINVGDESISDIIHRFKITYSRLYRNKYGSGKVWQNRFWDHVIRNQIDMNNHIDYIHYNPVRHRFVDSPDKWEFSSFIKYKQDGYYSDDWGVNKKVIIKGEFGE